MKKCPVCGTGKARRLCARHGGVEVCSLCCASIRDAGCGDCIHYDAARQHQAARGSRAARSAALPEGEFLIEINPEAEEAVNGALALAQQRNTKQAQDGFRKVIAMNDRNVASHGNLGLCYAQLGHKAKALAELDRALELDPAYKPARMNRLAVAKMTEGVCVRLTPSILLTDDLPRWRG